MWGQQGINNSLVVSKDVALFSNRNAEITKSRSEVDDLIDSSPHSDEFWTESSSLDSSLFLQVPIHRGLIEEVEDGSNRSSSNHVVIQVCIKVVGQGMNTLTEIHPAILSWLGNNWEREIGNHRTTVNCYTEMKNVNDGTLYRAHPNYRNGGPWQDWAMVSFVNDSLGMPKKVPLPLLIFYEHHFTESRIFDPRFLCW
jgi:hypothetical protein